MRRLAWATALAMVLAGCDAGAPRPDLPAGVAALIPPPSPTPTPKPSKPPGAPPLLLAGPSCWLWSPEHRAFDPSERLGQGRSGECYFSSYYAEDPHQCMASADGACRGGLGECGGAGDGLSVWFVTQNGPGTCRLSFTLANKYGESVTRIVEIEVGAR